MTKPARGGKRPGAGAKPGSAEFTATMPIRLTPAQLATVKANGGSKWVRALIEKETTKMTHAPIKTETCKTCGDSVGLGWLNEEGICPRCSGEDTKSELEHWNEGQD